MSNNAITTHHSNKVAEAAKAFEDAVAALESAEAEDAVARAANEPQPKINYETFTKAEAQKLFDNRRKNRQLRPAGVLRYTKVMDAGQWRTHDRAQSPILIDKKGKLAGGQHRVAAFIKSDQETITFPVARDASDEEIKNQDACINRTFNDYVAMFHSLPKFNKITEAKVNAVGKILSGQSSPTAEQVAETMINAQEAMKLVDALIGKAATVQRCAPLIAAFVRAHEVMDETVWRDALVNFDENTNKKGSPMALLASSLETRRQNELFLKALHALRATHDKQNVTELTADKAHLEWCKDDGAEEEEEDAA